MARAGDWVGPFDDPDRYELVEPRSRGGEGEVWKAHLRLDRMIFTVAVKIVHEQHMANVREWRKRWQRQTELLRSLDHPSLVRVREFFEGPPPHPPGDSRSSERTLYLAMNWEKGISLHDWVRRNPRRELNVAIGYIERIAAAVDYLHSGADTGVPVIHRDIKPLNILITGPVVRLVDFGLARLHGDSSVTFGGTPDYMALETIEGEFSPASDRYSLGATTYFVLVGNPPPRSASDRLAALESVPLPNRDAVTGLLMEMLDPVPERRPTSASRWASQLAQDLAGGTTVVKDPLSPESDEEPTEQPTVPIPPTRVDPKREITFIPPAPTPDPPHPPRRRGWKAPVGALASVVLVAVAWTAVARPAGLWPFTSTTTTSTSTTTTVPPRPPAPLPDAGPVQAGVYTSTKFKPPITFRLGDGWESKGNLSDSIDLARAQQPSRQLSIVRAQRTYRPDAFNRQPDGVNTVATALNAIEKVADDLPRWLQNLPATARSEISDITIAGRPAKALELTISGINYPPSCPDPCLLLFQREPAPPGNETSAIIRLQGQRVRFEVVDLDVAKVVLMYSARASELSNFVTEARSTFALQSIGQTDQLTSTAVSGPTSPVRTTDSVTLTAEVGGGCISSHTGTLVSFYEGAVRDDRLYGSAPVRGDGRATYVARIRSSDRPDMSVVVARYEGGADCERSTSPPIFIPLTP